MNVRKFAVVVALNALPAVLFADVPLKINFQGRFSSTGTIALEFYISSGTSESQRLTSVQSTSPETSDGVVNYMVTAATSIFTGGATRYLEVKKTNSPTSQSWIELVSVPFAYRAYYADGLAGGTTVQGTLSVTGNVAADTSTLFVDSANDRVGFGTTSPSTKLHMSSGTLTIDGTGPGIVVGGSHFVVTASSVGVGTASPGRKLDVSGTGNVYGKFQSTNVTGAGIEVKDTVEDWLIQADGGTGNHGLAFYDLGRSAYRMMIDVSGNVGVGTTSPGTKLEVAGNIKLNNSGADPYLVLARDGTTSFQLRSRAGNGNFDITDGAGTERLSINSSGYVGIGTSDPNGKLLRMQSTTGGYYETSDYQWKTGSCRRELKHNIQELDLDAVAALQGLKIKKYQYKDSEAVVDSSGTVHEEWSIPVSTKPYAIGYILDEVPSQLIPDVIGEDGSIGIRSAFAYLVMVNQTLLKEIEDLKNRVEILEMR